MREILAAAACTLGVFAGAHAQDAAVQRELLLRQQQQDTFSQQLRQSVERAKLPPGDLRRQQELEARQLSERQRLEQASDRQRLEVRPDAPETLGPYELWKAEQERRPLVAPVETTAPQQPAQPQPTYEPCAGEVADGGAPYPLVSTPRCAKK